MEVPRIWPYWICWKNYVAGTGDETQSRWHYDSTEGVCKQFDYGGKKGNGNRFLTRQSCEAACRPSQDVCELPKNVGPCSGQVEQFWYDKEKDECFTFDWGKPFLKKYVSSCRKLNESACQEFVYRTLFFDRVLLTYREVDIRIPRPFCPLKERYIWAVYFDLKKTRNWFSLACLPAADTAWIPPFAWSYSLLQKVHPDWLAVTWNIFFYWNCPRF